MDNRRAYGLAKSKGIDTTGLSPKEVWEALKEKGVTQENYSSDGAGGTHEATEAEKKRLNEKGIAESGDKAKKAKSKEEFFGEEFKGYKGAGAIEKLLKEKRGHIKNAFERPELGGIDLIWGDDNGGLLHTIKQRDKKLAKGEGTISGYDMVMKIPKIIDKGNVDNDDKGRINIDYQGYRVGILPTIYNDKINWIVTAMELL